MIAFFADLAQLHFLRPWWLPALLLLPLLAWRARRRAHERSPWREAVDAHLLPHLLEEASPVARRDWTARLALLGLALAILALAGPSVRKDEQPLWQSRQPLVIALDLSRAVLARDLPPNRLAQARAKLAVLLRERAGGQVALVAFADDAYTVAPLTDDAANAALFLDALSPDVMPAGGQRADRAIAWSQRLLQQTGAARGEILLLTDHADAAAIAAAAKARAAGYTVSTLGLGTAQGGVYEASTGLARANLDATSLRALAASGGGRYQPLSADDADLHALGVLAPRQDEGAALRGETAVNWRDDGYWLLPLALLCFLPLFRRSSGVVLVLAFVLWLPLPPAQAQQAESQGGTLWRRADQAAHARMQEGIAAYRGKDYARAIERFSTVGDADGQYNLGNALAQAGRLDDAIAAYDRALKLQPGMRDAIDNRKVVDAARKRQQQQQQNRNQKNQQKDRNQQKNENQQGQQQQQQGQQTPQDDPSQSAQKNARPQPPQEGKQSPAQPDKPQDARQQARADAAQRQRMQEALRKQQGEQEKRPQPAPGKPEETPEQRERRLANQAWLQRVPDDPGALLRARFQLEARRRRGDGEP